MTIPHETIMNDRKYEGLSLRKSTLVAGCANSESVQWQYQETHLQKRIREEEDRQGYKVLPICDAQVLLKPVQLPSIVSNK